MSSLLLKLLATGTLELGRVRVDGLMAAASIEEFDSVGCALLDRSVAAMLTLVIIVVILCPHVDNLAHIGGFSSGFLQGFVLLIQPQFGWMEREDLPFPAQILSKYKAWWQKAIRYSPVLLPTLIQSIRIHLVGDGIAFASSWV
ncbi:hypothetical protein ZIOFF_068456 [Zingiber officinale]|uniref:RHOMBOID-like protein n=1 Tax=Zingiber officinale TaxID=94328 RepID=A0A8J5CGY1_ZINOF|nr:hypothetical protein ZIOFF_068456 [Zingiber officinale]